MQLVTTTDREAVGHFLSAAEQYIDLAIPRGGESLIRRVAAEAKMPVIKHFTGNCHVYVDRAADLDMAERITVNSKCQRLGVCNTAESLVVHRDVAKRFLPRVAATLIEQGIELRGDSAHAGPGRRSAKTGHRGGFRRGVSGLRSCRSKSSIRSTRRLSTSIAMARIIPTRS